MTPLMQNTLIVLSLLGLAAFAYYLLVMQGDTALNTSVNETASIESQIFLEQLNQLKSVSLQTEIFSDQQFRSLVNQSATVQPQPVGRTNPFIPAN